MATTLKRFGRIADSRQVSTEELLTPAAEPGQVEIWRGDRTFRAIVGVGIGICVAATPAAVVAGIYHLSNTGLGWWLFVAAMASALAPFFYRLAFHPLLQAGPEGLLIRNVTNEHRVGWNEIRGFSPGYSGLTIELEGRRAVCAVAMGKSNYAAARGIQTRADRVASHLAERATLAGGGPVALPDVVEQRRSSRTARLVVLGGCVVIAGRIGIEFLR